MWVYERGDCIPETHTDTSKHLSPTEDKILTRDCGGRVMHKQTQRHKGKEFILEGMLVPETFIRNYHESLCDDGMLPAQHGLSDCKERKWIRFLNNYLVNEDYAEPTRGNKRGIVKKSVLLDDLLKTWPVHSKRKEAIINRLKVESEFSYIYFLSAPNGLVKIGKAVNVEKRLAVIRNQSPVNNLELIYHIRLMRKEVSKIEAYFHRLFDRKRKHGEWFDLSWKDMELVRAWDRNRKVVHGMI